MSRCTAEDLVLFFQSYGWITEYDEGGILTTGWQGKDKSYNLRVEVNSTIILFEVEPLLYLELDLAHQPEILAFLHDLNYQSRFVKLAVSESGSLSLSASALADGFKYENLAETLEIVGYYSDLLYDEINGKLDEFDGPQSISSLCVTH